MSYGSRPLAARPSRTASGPFEALLHNLLLNAPLHPSFRPDLPLQQTAVAPLTPSDDLPTIKVYLSVDGLYRLTYADLVSAGWSLNILDPRTLQISNQGGEISVWVRGEEDGIFDPDDFILFYGQAMTGRYTRQNVYQLKVGDTAGKRMSERDAAPTNGYSVPKSYPATLHVEEHPTWYGYWQNPPGREAQDHWYWTGPLDAPTNAALAFQMRAFDPASPPFLRLQFAGRTDDPISPDHHTRLFLNGTLVSEAWWDGQLEFQQTDVVTPALLVSGTNTLTVETASDTGATVNSLYVNWLELDYQASYLAQDDQLVLGAPAAGDYRFEIEGFGKGDIQVFDISEPASPIRLLNVESNPGGNGFVAVFEDSSLLSSRYLSLTPEQYRSPEAIAADKPSDLRNLSNGAD